MENTEDNRQKQFEQQLELLINYKKFHPNKDVYLSEYSLSKAIKWYNKGLEQVATEFET